MKKFLLNSTYFLLPVTTTLALLFCLHVKKKFSYSYIQDDCYNRSNWFYERIFESEKPVDFVFLGSSHTICSVQDSILETQISEAMHHPIYAVNAGYCRLGISLQYALLKDICEMKNPQLVVFEVREREDFFSHDMFPYIAETQDIFLAPVFVNRDYFADMHQAFLLRITYQKNRIYKTISTPDTLYSDFGFWPREETASQEILAKKEKQQIEVSENQMSAFRQKLNLSYSEEYVRRMVSICKEKNISFIFLFLPAYGNKQDFPVNVGFYKQLGTIVIPPKEILNKKSNWSDEGHLNVSGAEQITNWLSEALKNYLKKSESPLM